jgi:hypothetical protein
MGISALLANIAAGGGMATSNNYALEFVFPSGVSSVVGSRWGNLNTNDARASNDEERMMLFCDEVSLPGIQATTGQLTNVLPGSGIWYYPTGRMYNDIQLSFMCDANMTPIKKINDWMEYIFRSEDSNQSISLRYPNTYQATMSVRKTEKSALTDGGKYSLQYEFDKIWPYSIDQIPLSYGSSQLVKLTVNFYYRKWKLIKQELKEAQRRN